MGGLLRCGEGLLPHWLGLVDDAVHSSVCGGHVDFLTGTVQGFVREGWFMHGALGEAGGIAGCKWRLWYGIRMVWLGAGYAQSYGLNAGTAVV